MFVLFSCFRPIDAPKQKYFIISILLDLLGFVRELAGYCTNSFIFLYAYFCFIFWGIPFIPVLIKLADIVDVFKLDSISWTESIMYAHGEISVIEFYHS